MQVALITDALGQPTRGHHTTIQRWLNNVRNVGIIALPPDPLQTLTPIPDVVHGYHALHGGVAALELARRYGVPLVVSLGGTDLYACLQGDATVGDVLHAAQCVTGAFAAFGEMLSLYLGRDLPYRTVPRAIALPARVPDRPPSGRLRVLLPAGLRPVKDPMLAIGLAERLNERGVKLELTILAPTLDEPYAKRVIERTEALDFVRVDEIAFDRMAEAYARADVVWNTSFHEGGSNTLLEAVAYGCAIFARDIPGNRELLREAGAPPGLFEPSDLDYAEAFHRDLFAETPEAREARVEAGHAWLKAQHDPAAEARALERVWRDVVAAGS